MTFTSVLRGYIPVSILMPISMPGKPYVVLVIKLGLITHKRSTLSPVLRTLIFQCIYKKKIFWLINADSSN